MIEISGLFGSVTIPSPSTKPVVRCVATRRCERRCTLPSPTESEESLLSDDGVESMRGVGEI